MDAFELNKKKYKLKKMIPSKLFRLISHTTNFPSF